ncbi:MAG: hypothetical protein KJO52_14745 [Maribacter sp.]|nr:hypothetical protein [Maribacter sp.]
MLYRFVAYIKFNFTATNQHGVHSPFIYNFVTKCLYSKGYEGPKTAVVLLKCIKYFQTKSLHDASRDMYVQKQVKKNFPKIKLNKHPCDCIFLDCQNTEVFDGVLKDNLFHNNTVMLVNNIHHNRENMKIWRTMKENDKVTVSVDMFYCGALFFRKEQVKEHFKIRI